MYWTENPKLQLQKNDLDEFVDINDQPIAFFGNPDLLPPKIKLNYTIEMIDELVKCRDDIIYFAENYYKAQTPNGFNFIKLHPYQSIVVKDMVENQHYVLMMPRQMGKCIFKDTKMQLLNSDTNLKYEQTIEDLFNECKKEHIQENIIEHTKN